MGLFKRFSEKTKQNLGLTGGAPDFKPTSNARNVAMIDEARKFSKQLKTLHADLNELSKRYEGSMVVMKGVLNAPLPRVYEVSDKGPLPVDRETQIVGHGVNFDELTSSCSTLKERLATEVLHPLGQWLNAYREIKKKNRKCEDLRLELDAQRRAASAMAVTLDRQKTKVSAAAAAAAAKSAEAKDPVGGTKMENAEAKLQTEEDKVTRLTQRFVEREAEVFNALLSLIRDTSVLKQYAAVSLTVYEGAFATAHKAFAAVALTSVPHYGSVSNPGGSAPSASGDDTGTKHDTHASPGTPQPGGHPSPPAPPAWYTEARQQAGGTVRYESDDEDHEPRT